MPLSDNELDAPDHEISGPSRHKEIYHSVSAVQNSTRTGSLQIYYGPSSNFAFLQQLHRSLLLDDGSEIATPGEVQEGSAGLDLFNQRSLFFGNTGMSGRRAVGSAPEWDTLPSALLERFLGIFFKTLYHILSFVHEDQIRSWAYSVFDHGGGQPVEPARKSVTFAVLAIGAVVTEHLEWAEVFYKTAKIEAGDLDEIVNLHSVQFSLLLAVYQNTLGRPNQAYLHLGSATRKAYAMGLHRDIYPGKGTAEVTVAAEGLERRITMWCLYFHERWQAFSLGRICAIRRSEIACPFPVEGHFLAHSARLLDIAMQGADMIYGHRRLPLWETWKAAESVHNELRRVAEDIGLAFASRHHDQEISRRPMQTITLTSFYYHTILITFRPFLIVAASRARQRRIAQSNPSDGADISVTGDEMWLREACRYAVDSSRDHISFLVSSIKEIDICKHLRYNSFFIESCCTVLLYDSLMNKHTYLYNLEYIKAGLCCLDSMKQAVPGEPVTSATATIERILEITQRKMSGTDRTTKSEGTPAGREFTCASLPQGTPNQIRTEPTTSAQSPMTTSLLTNGISTWDQSIPQIDWGFDIFTTDLDEFFPIEDPYRSDIDLTNNIDKGQHFSYNLYRGQYY